MADFDIVKYRGGYHEKQRVLTRCKVANLPLELSERVMVGSTHEVRIRNWLARYPQIKSGVNQDLEQAQSAKRLLRYWFRDMRSTVGLQRYR